MKLVDFISVDSLTPTALRRFRLLILYGDECLYHHIGLRCARI